jgi:UDP-N-acetylmuramyl pentapeptide phosphotransferase/UDP-N-acetylglucosamine-1-phosphate transferase
VELPILGHVALGPAGAALGLVWVVGLMNAFNFMDGIDGIAGTQALAAGLGWALLGAWGAGADLSTAGLLVAGASLGFLWHNWPPARIFMGDVGSVYVGFLLAVLAVVAARRGPAWGVAGILLVWPFVFDASLTFLRRAARRENVLQPHRSHLYQRLVIAGWSHQRTTGLYGALAAAGLGSGAVYVTGTAAARLAALALVAVLAAGLWAVVCAVERSGATGTSDGAPGAIR